MQTQIFDVKCEHGQRDTLRETAIRAIVYSVKTCVDFVEADEEALWWRGGIQGRADSGASVTV